jgi:glycosyltransferase involved in cell wall biosynthesis
LPEVSVVVPTRNRSRLLALTLRSVLGQRDVDLEVVVVDEASTDDTVDVISNFCDTRIRVVHHDTPHGVAGARSRGWQEATGEWIAFVDDDDLWAPGKLTSQLTAAREMGRHWAYVGVINIDADGLVISGVPPPPPEQVVEHLPAYNAIPGGGSNVVARRALLDAVGPFDARHYNTEDWEMWLRLAKHGHPAWVPRPLLAYRVHTRNASLKIDAILAGAALIEQAHGARVDYGMLYRWFAETSLRLGRRVEALRYFALAAARGQARSVLHELTVIARRRVARPLGWVGAGASGSCEVEEWRAQALPWLDELAETAP